MKTIEIGDHTMVIGTESCNMIGSVTPIPDGVWIGVGYPHERGILIDNDQWAPFVELINSIDRHVKENYNDKKVCY
jgi:hypothetical protein